MVPRSHITNAVTLTTADLPLLDYMKGVGEKVLKERHAQSGGPQPLEAQFVFHIAPFNSINHIHLHCLALPFSSWWSAKKYTAGSRWCWDFDKVRQYVKDGKPIPDSLF